MKEALKLSALRVLKELHDETEEEVSSFASEELGILVYVTSSENRGGLKWS